MSDKKTNGLVFGKFNPPHNGHIHLIKEALQQTTGDVYLLVFDHPELGGIPTAERADLIKQIIPDSRLHIVECYDSPKVDGTPESRVDLERYTEAKLPSGVTIDKVFCNEPYGELAAKQFNAEWVKVDPDRTLNHISGTEIRKSPDKNRGHLHPLVAAKIFKETTVVTPCDIKFSGAIDSADLDAALTAEKITQTEKQFKALNAEKDPNVHLHMQDWNVGEFDQPHLPVVIGPLKDKAGFSKQKGIRLLDMAVRMPGQGWAIPKELEQFKESIQMAWNHERAINPDIDNYYVYVTVDQKLVQPNKTQRRPGYHSDAFETSETTDEHSKVDNTYIVYDAIPTLFQPGPFPLKGKVDPEDCEAVLKYFDKKSEGKPPITYPPHTMVKLTPYDIHTPAVNETGKTVERTFIKISFSKKPYNLIGNRINDTPDAKGKPILDYSGWEWVERDPHARNHRNRVVNWRREDHDRFTMVDTATIDFTQKDIAADWLKGPVEYAHRVEPVNAERVAAGEVLFTRHGDFNITYNISQANDWKITTSQGDQYLISDKKFKERYHTSKQDEQGRYLPKGLPQPVLEITKDVCMRSPWGSMQYLSTGSKLTQDAEGKTYGIHARNYNASYEKCEPAKDMPDTKIKAVDAITEVPHEQVARKEASL